MFFCFVFFIHTDFLESSREKVYSPSSWSFFCWRLTVCKWNQRLLHQKTSLLCDCFDYSWTKKSTTIFGLHRTFCSLSFRYCSMSSLWMFADKSESSKQRTGNHGNLLATKAPFFTEALYTSLQPISHADYHQLLSKVFSSEW